jgi:hypothetical protein
MSNYYLKLRISSKSPWKARKELKQYKSKSFFWIETELMQYKGLKYVPTIVYTASFIAEEPSDFLSSYIGLPPSYFEEIIKMFRELKQRIDVRIVRPKGRAEYALWSNDVLKLKEVQNEVHRLVTHPLLFKEDPDDRKMAMRLLAHSSLKDEEMELEEKIDREIEFENECVRDIGSYFLNLIDISKKYPSARFWWYVILL